MSFTSDPGAKADGIEPKVLTPPRQLHSLGGLTGLLEQMRKRFGDTMGYRLVVYPDYASLERPDPNEERRQLSYTYRGGWGDPSSSAKSDDDVLVDLGKFDPTAVIGVLRGAPETLGISPDDVSSTYLIVDPTREPVTSGRTEPVDLRRRATTAAATSSWPPTAPSSRSTTQAELGIPFAEIDVLYVRTRTSAPKRWFGRSAVRI